MRTRRWIPVLALFALLAGACGGEEAGSDAPEGAEPTVTDASDGGSDPAAAPEPDTDAAETEAPETSPAEGPSEVEAGAVEPEEAAGDEMTGATDGAGDTTLGVTETGLGEVLADGEGMVLYLFDPDEAGESTCYDDCAAAWPPLPGPAEAGDGADESLIGTTERDDGTSQVTYNGWPLYYYSGDSAPGDVNGQGLQDIWWLVSSEGERVTEVAQAAAS